MLLQMFRSQNCFTRSSLSIMGDNHLSSSVMLLARMIGDTSLTLKLKKLPLMATQHQDFEDESPFESTEKMLLQEEACIKEAKEMLELFKSELRNQDATNSTKSNPSDGIWSVAKSWTPCPIGMLPCSFSSAAVLPVVDEVVDISVTEDIETDTGNFVSDRVSSKRVSGEIAVENESGSKRLNEGRMRTGVCGYIISYGRYLFIFYLESSGCCASWVLFKTVCRSQGP
ncbi:uncharacterized protein A4U43_C01F34530 [Asparagus officinalis]|uniref:Uncharacterized protein n=2 Tax=Asparagus officinalis TaxID=4686 RepID=A0A5P1FUD0_ASPOF|nr:uncharacterized protein A4U43_C01F34530 [Asparagus officinalis]